MQAVAERYALPFPTGSRLHAIRRVSPRCVAPIRGTEEPGRSILFCGVRAEQRHGSRSRLVFSGRLAEGSVDNQCEDFRELFKIVNRHRLVKLVHGRVAEAEFNHRHDLGQKARVGGAA